MDHLSLVIVRQQEPAIAASTSQQQTNRGKPMITPEKSPLPQPEPRLRHRSILGFVAENKKIPTRLTHDLFYAYVGQQSSDGVHTFEDRKRERRSRTNIVGEDSLRRPQGRVVEQIDEDKCHKWQHRRCATQVRCIDVLRAPVRPSSGRIKTWTGNPAAQRYP
jgi:hypothetical protein